MQSKILETWYAERARWLLWLPVLLGLGIGLYFGLGEEPPRWPLTLLAAACWISAGLARRWLAAALVLVTLACVITGAALGAWRSHSIAAPILKDDLFPQTIEGVVEAITPRPDSTRLTLSHLHIPDLAPEETPRYATVSLREHLTAEVGLGDTIRIRAGFFPPPKPVVPGGYAFNRHFYFQQIGASGYTAGNIQPEVIRKAADESRRVALIERIRHHIATTLMARMGKQEGPVAAALTMGEQRAIPEEVMEAMRRSGLVHILSISGTHLSLAAGILFFSIRFGLAAIPSFAGRFDTKRPAALLALLGSYAYLLLAGSPISAQRSFIMVAMVLVAVMLSRNVTPMRSLCLAALVILLLAPESLLNPGFQLSFAATMGILAYYEYWREKPRETEPQQWSWKKKMAHFWGGIVITSIIATLATIPYILYHFEELPAYSVLANLLVLPLVSFVIMPAVVLVLLLMPFGLEGAVLPLLETGIRLMNAIALWITSLPYAVITLPPLSTLAVALVTFGGLWLCLWLRPWRHLGWLAIAAGMATLAFYQPPDMILSGDGKRIAAQVAEGQAVMISGQRQGFAQNGWLRFMQVDGFGLRKDAPEETLRCDTLGCMYHWRGKTVAIVQHRVAFLEDCAGSDVLIAPKWSVYRDAARLCPDTAVFDRRWLEHSGGMMLWLDRDGLRIRTVSEALGNRPWSNR